MQDSHFGAWPPGRPKTLPPVTRSVYEGLAASAARHPERVALRYYGGDLSYGALAEDVCRLAGYLHHLAGVRPNDRVALCLQNAPQFVIAYYAILAANAVVVPINPMSRQAELTHVLDDADVTAVIYGEDLADQIALCVGGRPCISVCYADYAAPHGQAPLPVALTHRPQNAPGIRWGDALSAALPAPRHDRTPQDWCLIPYSSGTTGRPKGCLHTHASVGAVIQAYPAWFDIPDGTKVLATLPFCHVTGMQHSMNVPLSMGATITLMSRWDAALAADLIDAHRIEHWRSITTMMIDFLSLPGIETRDLSSLTAVGGGGAQMPAAVAEKMARLIGLDYVEAYGLTETAAPSHINPPHRAKAQCLGIPIFGVDCRVLDPATGTELGPGQPGEIVTHGPQVFVGYWNAPEATAEAFVEIDGKRFLRTGDIGYRDAEGYFFFTDRLKRMINVSGLKVWPAEVESILHGHPDISEACIVGDPDPRTGEAVRAVLVARDAAHPPSHEALTHWCRENMATYKVPRRIEFRSALPRSSAGKVLWKDLKAPMQA